VEVREHDRFLIGHIEADVKDYHLCLSKHECTQIIMGYPPFYRKMCKTYDGVGFPHPSMEHGGIRRGGWVIAVGLTNVLPTGVYASSMKLCFDEACCRVRDMVCDYLHQGIDDNNFDVAKKILQFMCANHSGSGAFALLGQCELENLVRNRRCGDGLTSEQCIFAVSIFDRKEELSMEERGNLESILVPVLAAAVLGVHSVYQYVNNGGTELERDAQALFFANPMVYLRDCTGTE